MDAADSSVGHGWIVIWDSGSGGQITRIEDHDFTPVQVQFNQKVDLLVASSADGIARLWNTSTGDQIAVLKANGYLW
jgi:WD40 repeat protein